MRKLEFNPSVIDYGENEKTVGIGNGVKVYNATMPNPTLKDAIEKLSFNELYSVFGEKYIQYREPEPFPGYFPSPLSDLFSKFLEKEGVDKQKGIEKIYNLVCEKIAMDWMNENM